MSISVGSDQNRPMENEAYYELVASQEEIYLEEIEEELRAILTFDDLPRSQEVDDPLEQAAEELITGNSDDPPLSDETVRGMLHEPVSK